MEKNQNNFPKVLHRYMDFPELLHSLQNNEIVLKNPLYWDDKNDYFTIRQFVEKLSLKNLFVSCFTTYCDSYHFWKIYAPNPTGICVTYSTSKIHEAIQNDIQKDDFKFEKVEYETYRNLSRREVPIEEYPFIKRVAFKAENEYRLIFSSRNGAEHKSLKIDGAILGIVISPSFRNTFIKEYKELISSKTSLSSTKIKESKILNSNRWKELLSY
jgi:hypothetical protein